jgi:glycosyltransferase involved in cell wall biosynthesis
MVAMGAKTPSQNPAVGFAALPGKVIQAIGNHQFSYTAPFVGDQQIGYGFIEHDIIAEKFFPLAWRMWDRVVSGSTWMNNNMIKAGLDPKLGGVCLQGFDQEVFNYKKHVSTDSFIVGSFGKFEHRKGQDVVIKAFKLFKSRHKDVKLAYCWGNLWPDLIREMAYIPDCMVKVPNLPDEQYYKTGAVFQDILEASGIGREDRLEFHGLKSQGMAGLYGMCDVALMPNRCEAGQNLCLTEALAVGLPCIATNATGHADITGAEGYPCEDLNLNGGCSYVHKTGDVEIGNWHRPCLEEVVSQLEYAYRNRDELSRRRASIAEWGAKFTWDKSAETMANLIGD